MRVLILHNVYRQSGGEDSAVKLESELLERVLQARRDLSALRPACGSGGGLPAGDAACAGKQQRLDTARKLAFESGTAGGSGEGILTLAANRAHVPRLCESGQSLFAPGTARRSGRRVREGPGEKRTHSDSIRQP